MFLTGMFWLYQKKEPDLKEEKNQGRINYEKQNTIQINFLEICRNNNSLPQFILNIFPYSGRLGAVTNLNDFPRGDCGSVLISLRVGLAAGGFTICAVTHIFNLENLNR